MKNLILIVCFLIVLSGCGVQKVEDERFLFGTLIKMVVYDKDVKKAKAAIKAGFDEIERIDKDINNHSFESELYNLNRNSGSYVKISKESIYLLEEAEKTSELSNGTYNILIGELIELWNKAKEEKKLPNEAKIENLVKEYSKKNIWIDGDKVKLRKGIKLEAGSFLKGYAIKKAKEILKEYGIESAFISALSSIETINRKADGSKWKIGLQNPKEPSQILKILKIDNRAIGVSGDYQNYYEYNGKKYHHIINAKTGYPENKNRMLVVVADDSHKADLMSTALFSLDSAYALEIADSMEDIAIMVVDRDMNEYYSKGFEKYFRER